MGLGCSSLPAPVLTPRNSDLHLQLFGSASPALVFDFMSTDSFKAVTSLHWLLSSDSHKKHNTCYSFPSFSTDFSQHLEKMHISSEILKKSFLPRIHSSGKSWWVPGRCWKSMFWDSLPQPRQKGQRTQGTPFSLTVHLPSWILAPLCLTCYPQSSPRPTYGRNLCPWDSPASNTGVDYHFLLQGTFLTRGSIPPLLHLLHWRFFTTSTTWEAQSSNYLVFVAKILIYLWLLPCLFKAASQNHQRYCVLGLSPQIIHNSQLLCCAFFSVNKSISHECGLDATMTI